jgi:hypothetical protein
MDSGSWPRHEFVSSSMTPKIWARSVATTKAGSEVALMMSSLLWLQRRYDDALTPGGVPHVKPSEQLWSHCAFGSSKSAESEKAIASVVNPWPRTGQLSGVSGASSESRIANLRTARPSDASQLADGVGERPAE